MAIQALLGLIALLAIALPVLLMLHAPKVKPKPRIVVATRVVPRTELPPVEPVKLQEVDPTDAVAINALVPFSTEPNIPARAFTLVGSTESQGRAVDCLAAALYYEAGDDTDGEKAVAQVILNRARHPAFPKTICGVVFQGSERSTGCQFTFTCDGSMIRRQPSAGAWDRARFVARAALTGTVDKRVGLATHYHTDWVVPYWSSSLEKITEVTDNYGKHLFFRWTGWWGTPPAFRGNYPGVEPNIPLMSRLSPSHVGGPNTFDPLAPGGDLGPIAIDPESIAAKDVPPAIAGDANSFLVTLPKGMSAESFASLAVRTCGERPYCKFMAWADGSKTAPKLPLSAAQVATMSFSYLRDQNQGFAKALWNCEQYKRPSPVQCMRAQVLGRPVPVATPGAVEPPATRPDGTLAGPAGLVGVRRKGDPAPGAKPQMTLTLPATKGVPSPTPKPTPTPKAITP
jgi:spore germination cell wall hydrolase CwlJ-like protein